MFLARALFGRGAPAVAVRDAIQRAYADVHTDLQRIKELTDFASLDFLQGDVRAMDERLAAWEALAAKSSVDDVHYTFMRFKTWALFKDRPDDAATEAAAYLRMRSGLIVNPIDTDSSIFAYQVLYRAGRISRSQMGMSRASWLRGVTGEWSGNVWVWGFADGIVDEQDAAEAFGVLRRFVPLPDEQIRSIRFDEPIGRALLQAGRPAEAVTVLRRATASCRALEFPFRYVHALIDLGVAYERINDAEAACRTFERVLALVPAKTRTLSAQAARHDRATGLRAKMMRRSEGTLPKLSPYTPRCQSYHHGWKTGMGGVGGALAGSAIITGDGPAYTPERTESFLTTSFESFNRAV